MVSVNKKVDFAVSILPFLIMLILILLIIECAFIQAASLLFVCLCGMSESKAAYSFRVYAHLETFFRVLMLCSLHSRVCAHFETFFRAIAKLTLSELHFRVCANFETFFRAIRACVCLLQQSKVVAEILISMSDLFWEWSVE
jgi:hypothetical protein